VNCQLFRIPQKQPRNFPMSPLFGYHPNVGLGQTSTFAITELVSNGPGKTLGFNASRKIPSKTTQAYAFLTLNCLFPPCPDTSMVMSVLPNRIKQDVQGNNFHWRGAIFLRLSSSSNCAAKATALVRSTLGGPKGWVSS
jgi:hypothetical protein